MPTPSFILAPGHPDDLFAAADWHDGVASSLWEHAGTITASAGSALAVWQGEAATAYQGLASAMAFSFQTASNQSGEAAGIYRQVAREVDRCQQEGRAALAQAEHWCEEITQDNQRVITAQSAIAAAQLEIESAAKIASMTARTPGANVAAAQAQVSAAEDRLHQAQGQLRAAQQDLEHAQQELTRWDRRGQQLYEEAALAVEHVTGLPLSITPPPMPGAITGPISPLSKQAPPALQPHSDSVFGRVLGVIQEAATVVSAGGGICASTLFWNPVGDVCGIAAGAASGVSAVDGALQAATGHGSIGAAAVEAAGAIGGVASFKLGEDAKGLLTEAKGASGSERAVLKTKAATRKAVSGALSGVGGTASVGGALERSGPGVSVCGHMADHGQHQAPRLVTSAERARLSIPGLPAIAVPWLLFLSTAPPMVALVVVLELVIWGLWWWRYGRFWHPVKEFRWERTEWRLGRRPWSDEYVSFSEAWERAGGDPDEDAHAPATERRFSRR